MATTVSSPAKSARPLASAQPAVAPNNTTKVAAPQAPTPITNSNLSTQPSSVSNQPLIPQQPSAARVQKPEGKFAKLFHKPDWLFLGACVIVVCLAMLLASLENAKNEYVDLKKEDADRIYVVQKASSLTQKDIDVLEHAFLNEKDVISFIQTIETASPTFDEFSLTFTSDEPQGKDPKFLSFSIVAVGEHQTLMSFFEKLLGSTYAIEAEAISMKELEEDPTKITAIFSGNIYIQGVK